MVAPVYYSADTVRALPADGNRYETVYGELLVTPAPRLWHQEIVGRLFFALHSYLERHPVGHALMSPADISWRDDTLVQPDLFVMDREEARTLDWARIKTLHLVVEVLSPSSARSDRFTKRRLYQNVRIPVYWMVNADARTVEVWTPDATLPSIERESVIWAPSGAGEPLVMAVERLLAPI